MFQCNMQKVAKLAVNTNRIVRNSEIHIFKYLISFEKACRHETQLNVKKKKLSKALKKTIRAN